MKLKEFLTYIAKGQFQKIECLITPETLLEKKLVEAIQTKIPGLTNQIFYGSEASISDILNSLYQTDLFAQKKIIIVREFDLLKWDEDSITSFIKICEDPQLAHYLIFSMPENRKVPKKINQFLQNQAHVIEIKTIYPNEMQDYIIHYVKQLGKNIDKSAVDVLVEQIGTDLQEFHSQMEKILLFLQDKSTITRDDILQQVSMTSHQSVFRLVDSIMESEHTNAIRIIKQMLASGQHPLMLLSVIIKQLQQLQLFILLKKSGKPVSEIKKIFGFRDFQINKFDKYSYVFTSNQLGKMIDQLKNLDKELKMRQLPSLFLEVSVIKHILTIMFESKK